MRKGNYLYTMCTAITLKTKDFYFGRTLDYDFSYKEEVTVTPRNYPLPFRHCENLKEHRAIIGMAYVKNGYPLYYDAVNEDGLCMAGLNFVGNAYYSRIQSGKTNLAQFELIPYLLGKCKSVKQAVENLKNINLADITFCDGLPSAQLHWLLADRDGAVTVEFLKEGLKIYKNPVGVLTNNPPFDMQTFNLNNYMGLTVQKPRNSFSKKIKLKEYSRGMGAIGLPGDLSSHSRFVKAAFVKLNLASGSSENESVGNFFHILETVSQTRGVCVVDNAYEITIYTSCCNADKGIYYYTTYENRRITAVDMHAHDLDGKRLFRYPVSRTEDILFVNK